MSHTQDPVAGALKRLVPHTVALECRARTVEGIAVELHDQSPVRPDGVHFEASDDDVHRGSRQPRLQAEIEEPPLEDGPRLGGIGVLEQVGEGLPTRMSAIAIAHSLHRGNVQYSHALGLLERGPELSLVKDLPKVQERASDAGDRDPVMLCPIVRMQVANRMEDDTGSTMAAASWVNDVDRSRHTCP